MVDTPTAMIGGVGPGLGEVLAKRLVAGGYQVVGLARTQNSLTRLHEELNNDPAAPVFKGMTCDLTDGEAVENVVTEVWKDWGDIDLYVHNPSGIILKPFLETDVDEFEALWRVFCLGAVNATRAVLPSMLKAKSGCLVYIGATSSVKAGPKSAAFASAKFALRGLAQSLARAHGPDGVHVAHLVIDGVIWSERASDRFGMAEDHCLDPRAIAETCYHIIMQDRSAWTHELDIRPDVENF
jgi:NADP-dependent 3-hydroxy acid dehydrogenase YdfG